MFMRSPRNAIIQFPPLKSDMTTYLVHSLVGSLLSRSPPKDIVQVLATRDMDEISSILSSSLKILEQLGEGHAELGKLVWQHALVCVAMEVYR